MIYMGLHCTWWLLCASSCTDSGKVPLSKMTLKVGYDVKVKVELNVFCPHRKV
jgi:hypothetical protein